MKSKFTIIISFLLFCIFSVLCHSEIRAEAGIFELRFNLIKQSLRPFENISFEFMTELENQKTKQWEQEGRHRIIVDFSKGFYKLSSVKKNPGSKHCSFVERGWDGKYAIRVEKDMKFTQDLKFVGICDNRGVLATASSSADKYLLSHLCSFLRLYEGRRFDESLYSIINISNMRGFVFLQKSRNEIALSNGRDLELTFNKENGALLCRIEKVGTAGGGVCEMQNHKVEKVENKDGWFFPAQVVSTYRDSMDGGKIVLRRRTTLVPNTLSINDKIAPEAFTPKIPVRASLLNDIENTQRIVTELDPFLDREGFQKQMDTFVDELRKDLKR